MQYFNAFYFHVKLAAVKDRALQGAVQAAGWYRSWADGKHDVATWNPASSNTVHSRKPLR